MGQTVGHHTLHNTNSISYRNSFWCSTLTISRSQAYPSSTFMITLSRSRIPRQLSRFSHVFPSRRHSPMSVKLIQKPRTPTTTTTTTASLNTKSWRFSIYRIPSISSLWPYLTTRHHQQQQPLPLPPSQLQNPNLGLTEKDVIEEEVNQDHHPYAFHVSGPRNISSPNWKQLFSSSWNDGNYKRAVVACLVQAVYLLEIDRQENRTGETSLALNWWKPFKYEVTQILVDQRDGSIFGALLEWDRSAALADLILMRPRGAPRVVLALRGTLLSSPTFRRDIEGGLRFVAWESLEGSVRYSTTLEALKSAVERYGSSNICIAGHSLGAGFALEVGKTLAKEGIFLDTHLFNPPSVSLALSLRSIGETAGSIWRSLKPMLPYKIATKTNSEKPVSGAKLRRNWAPHLYVNNNDYICCYYNEPAGTSSIDVKKKSRDLIHDQVAAKLFVMSKENEKFFEAHRLEQWWSDNLEPQFALHSSRLISSQLKCLYTFEPSSPSEGSNNNKSLLSVTKATMHLFSSFLAAWLSIPVRNLGGILWTYIPRQIYR